MSAGPGPDDRCVQVPMLAYNAQCATHGRPLVACADARLLEVRLLREAIDKSNMALAEAAGRMEAGRFVEECERLARLGVECLNAKDDAELSAARDRIVAVKRSILRRICAEAVPGLFPPGTPDHSPLDSRT